jgi:hypothetical protein
VSDQYLPWWLPADHRRRAGEAAAAARVKLHQAGAPPSEVRAPAIDTLTELAAATPPGAFAEIGVYKGGTAWHLASIAREQNRELHLFDTFTGIPEAGKEDINFHVGDFGDAIEAEVRTAIPEAVFHVGTFPATLPAEMPPLAFVHCDCDQYRTTHAVVAMLRPIMVTGGVMLFDDTDHVAGAIQAVTEAFPEGLERTPEGKMFWRKP